MTDFSIEFEKYLNLYLDGRMDPEQERMFELYLAENPDKAEEMRAYKTLDLNAKEEELPELADGYWDGLNARIDARIAGIEGEEAFRKGFWRRLGDMLFSPGNRMKIAAGFLSVLAVAMISRHFVNTLSVTQDATQPVMKYAEPITPLDERDTMLELHEEIPDAHLGYLDKELVDDDAFRADESEEIQPKSAEKKMGPSEESPKLKPEGTKYDKLEKPEGTVSLPDNIAVGEPATVQPDAMKSFEPSSIEKPEVKGKDASDEAAATDTTKLSETDQILSLEKSTDDLSLAEPREIKQSISLDLTGGEDVLPDNGKVTVLKGGLKTRDVAGQPLGAVDTFSAKVAGDSIETIRGDFDVEYGFADNAVLKPKVDNDSVRYGEEEMDGFLYESEDLGSAADLLSDDGRNFPDLRNEVFAEVKGLDEKEVGSVSPNAMAAPSGSMNRSKEELEILSLAEAEPNIDSMRQALNQLLDDYEMVITAESKAFVMMKIITANLQLARATKDQNDIDNGQQLIRIATSIGILSFPDFEAYTDSLNSIRSNNR